MTLVIAILILNGFNMSFWNLLWIIPAWLVHLAHYKQMNKSTLEAIKYIIENLR